MLDFKTFERISCEAKKSMKKDSDGDEINSKSSKILFFLIFYVLPFGISFFAFHKKIIISEIAEYIGTVISIFTGLFFSLLLSIEDKVKNQRDNKDRQDSNFQKYKENMKQISNIVLYIILLGVEIFMLLFLNSLFGNYLDGCIEILITIVTSFLLMRFIISLLFVIQRFYYTSRDEIGNIL
ncbi:MAG TPA: hypothetical protein DEF88_00590 [Porphyromonadaceae bacterium]|jgi:fatty-acid desaturase|nr:hypothetical protein [Porphyromonadaceae bacterium]HBX18929.1 hypothetical protein [Porphyromonadaceae bacterium]HCM21112.1 hypothetical protein [Porphyromonadaceae bacterium]